MNKYIIHYGIPLRSGRYPAGSGKNPKTRLKRKQQYFISGSSKTQEKGSKYYRGNLPRFVKKRIKKAIKSKDTIIVGDAPGIDRQVQDYLNKKKYNDVVVYSPGKNIRYRANKNWKSKKINNPKYQEGSKEWLRQKDIAMQKRATKGLAVILDQGANATRENIRSMRKQGKDVEVYCLSKYGWLFDRKYNRVKKI